MSDLVIMDALADGGTFGVARFDETVSIGQCEIEVGLFESEPHRGQERAGAGGGGSDRGRLLPEIVGMVIAIEATTVGGEPIEIESTMQLFVRKRREPGAAQFGWHLGPAQDRPGEILDGLEFVMRKARQAENPLVFLLQLAGFGESVAASAHAEACAPMRSIERHRLPRRGVDERLAARELGRLELGFQSSRFEDESAEGLDRLRRNRAVVRRSSWTLVSRF